MEKDPVDIMLLFAYFAGAVSGHEREQVDVWLNQSEDNRLFLANAYQLYYSSQTLDLMQNIDSQKALQQLKRRAKRKRRQAQVKQLSSGLFVLLLVGVFAGIWLHVRPAQVGEMQYVEVRSTSGLISRVELPDGSSVWLNSGSYLKYPVRFANGEREVYVTGEAYFSVVKAEQSNAFVVHTLDDVSIRVVGTEFNVDAYAANGRITTTVVKGAVVVRCGQAEQLALAPEQQLVYNRQTKLAQTCTTYLPKDIAWKGGEIVFRNTPFEEALWILSKRYQVHFVVQRPSLRENSFTGTFTDQSLFRVLEHFKRSSGINYRQKQAVEGCNQTQPTEIEFY